MPYGTLEQVASRCRGLDLGPGGVFNANTFVTANDVNGWLDEAETEVNQTLAAIGGSPPYTLPAAQSLLGQITVTYAEARVYMVYEKANGTYRVNSPSQLIMQAYKDDLCDMIENESTWLAKLGESNPGTFRGHVSHGNQGDTVADGDFDTRFPRTIADTGF